MTDATAFRWPAEWEPQDGVLVAFPHEGTDWADNLEDVERTYVALIGAIVRFERAIVLVADDAVETRARSLLEAGGVPFDRITFVRLEYDDTWLRDTGPITLADGSRFRVLDFRFTGWGGKFGASRDDLVVQNLYRMGLFANAEHARVDWALEGGGVDGDGAGTILSTTQCLQQRHPNASQAELKQILAERFNAKRVHLLEHGALEGDDTDAHIDTLARFASPDHIVYQGCDDPTDPHDAELAKMADELRALRRADGSPYRLTELPWSPPIRDAEGRRLAASYANFLVVNGAVLMPAYGDAKSDRRAAELLGAAFPGREIVPVDCRPLIEQNGSLHCVTMQLPKGVLAALR